MTARRLDPSPAPTSTATPVLDVVIPVYDEEGSLAACVRRLHAHLATYVPYPFRITVADNASTDSTWEVAQALTREFPEVTAVHLTQKGRGRALKQVWLDSDATVLAYMDVDLSTDLDALWPLVAPLLSGHSDLAIGSRLANGSRVVRGGYREFVSRSYNLVLRTSLSARFGDAQCGFKAIRADVARALLPHVKDTTWFFDTELLVLAERCNLRIHEVPVDWFDDPDSRVDVVGTALDDLRGVARMRRSLARGEIPTGMIAADLGRGRLRSGLGRQLARFAGVGVASTAFHLGVFASLDAAGLGAQAANTVALLLATVANTAANRWWTFEAAGREGVWRQQVEGLGVFALFWALGAAALRLLDGLTPGAGTGLRTLVVGLANVLATVTKFLVLRRSMDPGHGDRGFFLPENEETTDVVPTIADADGALSPARKRRLAAA
ncbi:bifunctional glycosyltransferase family 2/GtrA family protein [Mobilicoccus pelagius]|uniref:dolichyl-phosphate beta-glucosyltransferase n=1 Tax=Mobilicoccus pelagius NBRC 104925 TaxID=1089455 RepID=H5UW67_9MICO|nr:bifunctional glycosyltransferase family 2/GtrA family protein [Mobilicoccus pelagius]GAB49975.1 putative glycosyltransferase [Mobilicoccus pelagius NBRC 104925]